MRHIFRKTELLFRRMFIEFVEIFMPVRFIVVEIIVDTAVANGISGLDNFVDIVGDAIDFTIRGVDGFHALHFSSEEAIERLPERFTNEIHRHLGHFAFLHKNENFGEFIECAKTAWEEDVDFGAHGKHNFASEEIMKLHFVGNIGVDMLLVGELNVETNAATAGFIGAFVSGFHDTRATTGNDGMAILGELVAELFGELAPFAVHRQTSGAKN